MLNPSETQCGGFHTMTRCSPVAVALLVVILVPAHLCSEPESQTLATSSSQPTQQFVRSYTPRSWQEEDVVWCRDTDPKNKIDDIIDAVPDSTFDIIVNYRRCVEDGDLDWLRAVSPPCTIQAKLKYVSSVAVANVSTLEMAVIAGNDDVAFIERQVDFTYSLGRSTPTIKVAPGHYSPHTVREAFPAIDGTGVNVVMIDSGVDNHRHETFAATPIIGYYDVLYHTEIDPVDRGLVVGHGTHVASIILGQGYEFGGETIVDPGVAPAAGLIDVALPRSWGGTTADVIEALEYVYVNRNRWSVDILNMCFGGPLLDEHGNPIRWDGRDVLSQLVDLAEGMGIVAISAAGNFGEVGGVDSQLSTPACATRVLAVAASATWNDDNRDNDVIPSWSSHGPRYDDADHDVIDELKPEVTAPGCHQDGGSCYCRFDPPPPPCDAPHGIKAARPHHDFWYDKMCGTSMSCPHVSGVAALVIQRNPGITPASVKQRIISTAEPKGAPWDPQVDPVWNEDWGWGLVDAYEAVRIVNTTDLTFPNHPAYPNWNSDDITVVPLPREHVMSTITAQIVNQGTNAATDVRIHFGIYRTSAGQPAFEAIGTKIVDIPTAATVPVSVNWTPSEYGGLGVLEETDHRVVIPCVHVDIAYGADSDYSNNSARKCMEIRGLLDPEEAIVTGFEARNPLSEEAALIEFEPSFEFPVIPPWTVDVSPPNVTLGADDCPQDIDVLLSPPPGAGPGATQIVHVAAKIGSVEVGGVSVQGTILQSIPSISRWGLVVLMLIIVTAAIVLIRHRQAGFLSRENHR